MIYLLPIEWKIRIIGALSILFFIISAFLLEYGLLRLLTITISAIVVAMLILNKFSIWRKIWKVKHLSNIYPDLNGVWEGTQDSNWSIIEKMNNASKSKDIQFDAKTEETPLTKTVVRLKIKADLFKIEVEFDSGYSKSKTFLAIPRINKETGDKELIYFYKNHTDKPKKTDAEEHTGIARLRIYENNNGLQLVGRTLTDRQWREGKNTAGILTIYKVSDDTNSEIWTQPLNHQNVSSDSSA